MLNIDKVAKEILKAYEKSVKLNGFESFESVILEGLFFQMSALDEYYQIGSDNYDHIKFVNNLDTADIILAESFNYVEKIKSSDRPNRRLEYLKMRNKFRRAFK